MVRGRHGVRLRCREIGNTPGLKRLGIDHRNRDTTRDGNKDNKPIGDKEKTVCRGQTGVGMRQSRRQRSG